MDLLKNEILPLVEQAAEGMGLDASLIARVLQPARELDQGDLSLPCFPFAKALGMAPAAIAEQLADAISAHPSLRASTPSTATSTSEHHRHGWRNNSWKDDIEARACASGSPD